MAPVGRSIVRVAPHWAQVFLRTLDIIIHVYWDE